MVAKTAAQRLKGLAFSGDSALAKETSFPITQANIIGSFHSVSTFIKSSSLTDTVCV